ncbi:hypothetical protein SLA2020_099210 [Shorea laevis]
MARRYCYSEVLPFAAMVGAECSTVGLNILFKAATLRGMSYNIFNAYSFAISALVLIPFLFVFPSSAVLPSFKFPLISRICLLAFIGKKNFKESRLEQLTKLQTQVMKMYPAEFIVVFLYNLFATVMCMPVCLIAEPNLSSWILSPSIAIAAVIYSGLVGAVINVVHTWGLHLKGPVYIAIFKPLSIVIAAAMSALVLGDALYLGSVIKAVIISIGFYAVIWGKAKEEAMEDSLVRSLLIPSSNDQFPLSQSTKL